MHWSFKTGMLLVQVTEAVSAHMKNVSFGSYPLIWIKREKDALVASEKGKVITLQLNVLILVQCGLPNNFTLFYFSKEVRRRKCCSKNILLIGKKKKKKRKPL